MIAILLLIPFILTDRFTGITYGGIGILLVLIYSFIFLPAVIVHRVLFSFISGGTNGTLIVGSLYFLSALSYFVIGAIIGLIVGKVKSKQKQAAELPKSSFRQQ